MTDPRRVTMAMVQRMQDDGYRYDHSDLVGPSREQPLALYRQITMWVLRNHCNLSYPRIGKILDRDHTTVMHGVAVVDGIFEDSPGKRKTVDDFFKEEMTDGQS